MAESLKHLGAELWNHSREHLLASLIKSVEIKFPDEIRRQIATLVANGLPIILATNHQSHADIIPLALLINQIITDANALIETGQYTRTVPIPGFQVPIAVTVLTGAQNQVITGIYQMLDSWLEQNGVIAKPVTRDKDRKILREGKKLPSTQESTRELLTATTEGYGLAILVSGTVEEGRWRKHTRQRIGMKKIDEKNLFTTILTNLHNEGENAVNAIIVPIGFSGTFNIFDPNSRLPTLAVLSAVAHNLRESAVPKILASATVGQPIITEDLWLNLSRLPNKTNNLSFLNNAVLAEIAKLLPPKARGEFL